MAFFGLTQIGYQNLIKERTIPDFREGSHLGELKYLQTNPVPSQSKKRVIALQNGSYPIAEKCPGVSGDNSFPKNGEPHSACPNLFPPILPKQPSQSERVFEHGNSYSKLMDLRYRHVRSGKEPVELYRYPVLTSHEIGRWRTREPLEKCEAWTKQPRFIYSESEMTKFVNKMALSNREFSLF